jgi:ribonuclease BN (tRNA processing enzyme)
LENFIKFLGTGGARFVVSKQLRATGGLWLRYRSTNIYIDPGPGALVKIHEAKNGLDPGELDGIILTHKHLDHSSDVNVLIEAMTHGGFNKRGVLVCPADAINEDAVVLKYLRDHVQRIDILREKGEYTIGDVTFTAPIRHHHAVETYGIILHLDKTVGIISDTRYFDGLAEAYHADYLIVNVLRAQPIEPHETVDHLAVDDFVRIITAASPKIAVMTHFGMNIIRQDPDLLAEKLKAQTGIEVIAAYDGMELPL